ncbi:MULTISPECIES: thioredoxin family protein [Bizionia]|uniref:Thioredoxin family protein n=1 Tax=Bizionia algoritergicola TaxID=291187 RepID=A0A5D0QTZ0_9FLAO|nr:MULTISPECIES: thioredoxin family protein [Bizionia]OBX21234.1 alkyl hydroperoxide reductase [Bizionia sp. APA-3]TYB71654.1 thioredoxin family protein [Bizionia algoritergicola]
MAQTPSNMLPLGTKAKNFNLKDTVSNDMVTLESAKGVHATVIMFICNHCPYVIHVNSELVKLAKTYKSKGVNFIAISSNDAENYPQDAPEKMKEHAINEEYIFPYLYDQTQEIAKAYQAACTPDLYVFDKDLELTYRGQLDDSRPGNNLPVTGSDLRHALDCIIENKENDRSQKPSMGCNIKWKK